MPPPLQSCLCADSTPSRSGADLSRVVIADVTVHECNKICTVVIQFSLMCPLRLPKKKQSADMERLGAEKSRGRARLPQPRCIADFMVHSPGYSPLPPCQSSSEDSSSEQSSSSYISSPGRDGPSEIPKLSPPPYGFHFGAQKQVISSFPNQQKNANQAQYQAQSSPGHIKAEDPDMGKCFFSSPVAHGQQRGVSSSRSILKPPPPYTRLVRTPSLKEYPNHAIRLMPREIVSEELKSWHQRNQLQKLRPSCGEKQGSLSVTSPTSPHLPLFNQVRIEHFWILFQTRSLKSNVQMF